MDRSKGIGGTDIGAIIGVNPWGNAMGVYLEKVGITEDQPDNEAMWWGREMEPTLAKRYTKETGRALYLPDQFDNPLSHNYFDWYLGSPDALYNAYLSKDENEPSVAEGGVDFKTTGRRNDYGEPGSDAVPDWVATQMHWYMGLTGAKWWDVAVLFFSPRREFHIYHLERNQEIIDNLIAAGRDFWENHVVPKVPPEIDASEASRDLLRHLYPDSRGEVLPAPDNAQEWRELLFTASEAIKTWEEKKKLAQHHLEALVGDADSLLWPDGWRFDWKKQKDRTSVDFAQIAAEYEHRYNITLEEAKEVEQKFIKITPGFRVPRLWPPKKENK